MRQLLHVQAQKTKREHNLLTDIYNSREIGGMFPLKNIRILIQSVNLYLARVVYERTSICGYSLPFHNSVFFDLWERSVVEWSRSIQIFNDPAAWLNDTYEFIVLGGSQIEWNG